VTILLLADRCEIMRSGLAALLLKANYTIVSDCATTNDVLIAAKTYQPDVALIGENIAGPSTATFLLQLRSHSASVRVVLVCESYDSNCASEAVTLHADGLILQAAAGDRLIECVRRVVEGYQWIDPDLLRPLLYAQMHSAVLEVLTLRETEVANLVSRGLRNKEIARQMNISEATVKMHLHHIYEKLHLASRTQLAVRSQPAATPDSWPRVKVKPSGNGAAPPANFGNS
jgi:two-component system nitrate/nitrite response regulator NarL